MSVQSQPRAPPRAARAAPQLSPDTARGPLEDITQSPVTRPHPLPARHPSLRPQSRTPFLHLRLRYHQRKLQLGDQGRQHRGRDVPKMPTQHPRASTLIPPNSCSPSADPPVQGYDPLHESDTLIVEHRRAGKLLKSQDIHKMTLPKDLNYHCETIRNG